MEKLRAVVVGLGRQNLDDHLPAMLAREDTKLVAVADTDPLARQRFQESFPEVITTGVRVYEDYRQMLEEQHPDYAIVAVPHYRYPEIVRELCSHGIYFLKEKPLARNLSEAYDLLSVPGFTKYAMVAVQRRFSGLYDAAWQHLADIGTPYLFNADYRLNIAEPHLGWRGDRELAGGGCLIDMGYHLIDQLTWWFGVPDIIHANISTLAVPDAGYTAEDSATVLFGYQSGLHGTLVISRSAGVKSESYEVCGTNGRLAGSRKGVTVFDRSGQEVVSLAPAEVDMIQSQLNLFVARIRSGKGFSDLLEAHLDNMYVIERCYAAAMQI